MDIKRAINTAELWEAGKMIGGDEDEVRNALLAEVKRLKDLGIRLKDELESQWLQNHDERCTNMENCASFGHQEKHCYEPRPKVLDEEI